MSCLCQIHESCPSCSTQAPVGTQSDWIDATGWIQTYTGRQFWPLNPREQDIDIHDIAHSLSLNCRFTGHCRSFYSIAQHSIYVAANLPDADPLLQLAGLLHDASEAYLLDLAKPVKICFQQYQEAEERLMRLLASHFQFAWPLPQAVKEMDTILLVTERRDLMPRPLKPFSHDGVIKPLPFTINPWHPGAAEAAFLAHFNRLMLRLDRH